MTTNGIQHDADPNVEWAKATGNVVPLPDDAPDLMSTLQVVEAWNECAEANRRLREGLARAIAVLEDPLGDGRHRTARELRELLDRQSSGNPGQLEPPHESG